MKKIVKVLESHMLEPPFNNDLKAKINSAWFFLFLSSTLVSFCVFVYFQISINNIFGHHILELVKNELKTVQNSC